MRSFPAGDAAACAGAIRRCGRRALLASGEWRYHHQCQSQKTTVLQGRTPLPAPNARDGLNWLFEFREWEVVYRDDGGPRGAMPCGTTSGSAITTPNSSRRLTAGAISMAGVAATIADPAAEQIGQTCESNDWELKSTQQCNCAPNSRLARIIASSRVSLDRFRILRSYSLVSYYTRPAPKRHHVADRRSYSPNNHSFSVTVAHLNNSYPAGFAIGSIPQEPRLLLFDASNFARVVIHLSDGFSGTNFCYFLGRDFLHRFAHISTEFLRDYTC